jgi:hypothetical protein
MSQRGAGARALWLQPLRFGAATSDQVRQAVASAGTEWGGADPGPSRTLFFLLMPTTLTSLRRIWTRETAFPHGIELSGTAGAIHVFFDRATSDDDLVTTAILKVNRYNWLFVTRDTSATQLLKAYVGSLTDAVQLAGTSTSANGSGTIDTDVGLLTTIGNNSGASPTTAFQGLIACYGMVNRVLSLNEMRAVQFGLLQGPPIVMPGLLELLNLGENGAGQSIASYGMVDPLNYAQTGTKGAGSGFQPRIPLFTSRRRRIDYKAPASTGVNGVAALTLPALAATGQASLSLNATASLGLPGLAVSSASSLSLNAAASLALPALAAAAASSLSLNATAALPLPALAGSSAASVSVNAQFSRQLPALSVTSAASIRVNAVATLAMPSLGVASTATVSNSLFGEAVLALPALAAIAAASLTIRGASVAALPSLGFAATGALGGFTPITAAALITMPLLQFTAASLFGVPAIIGPSPMRAFAGVGPRTAVGVSSASRALGAGAGRLALGSTAGRRTGGGSGPRTAGDPE